MPQVNAPAWYQQQATINQQNIESNKMSLENAQKAQTATQQAFSTPGSLSSQLRRAAQGLGREGLADQAIGAAGAADKLDYDKIQTQTGHLQVTKGMLEVEGRRMSMFSDMLSGAPSQEKWDTARTTYRQIYGIDPPGPAEYSPAAYQQLHDAAITGKDQMAQQLKAYEAQMKQLNAEAKQRLGVQQQAERERHNAAQERMYADRTQAMIANDKQRAKIAEEALKLHKSGSSHIGDVSTPEYDNARAVLGALPDVANATGGKDTPEFAAASVMYARTYKEASRGGMSPERANAAAAAAVRQQIKPAQTWYGGKSTTWEMPTDQPIVVPPSAAPAAPGKAATPTVKTREEYDKLPVGASYIGPDGNTYTKEAR